LGKKTRHQHRLFAKALGGLFFR